MRHASLIIGILLIGFSVALADDFTAVIKKVNLTDKKPGIKVAKKGKDPKDVNIVVELADEIKVTWNQFNKVTKKLEEGELVENGLQNPAFEKADKFDRGIPAHFFTNQEGQVNKIIILGSKLVVMKNLEKVLVQERQEEEKKAKKAEETKEKK